MTDIATLNDTFRKTLSGGRVMLTAGINAMSQDDVAKILSRVRSFNDFTEDNDPYGEHETSLGFAISQLCQGLETFSLRRFI